MNRMLQPTELYRRINNGIIIHYLYLFVNTFLRFFLCTCYDCQFFLSFVVLCLYYLIIIHIFYFMLDIGLRLWQNIKDECLFADVAELADAHGSGPCESNFMQVQVLSSAPYRELLQDLRCSINALGFFIAFNGSLSIVGV